MKNRAAEETATPQTLEQSAAATEAPAPLERILIKSDPRKHEQAKAAFTPALSFVQEALSAYVALNAGPITLKELFNFAINPNASLEAHVRDYLYESNELLKTFPQSKASLLAGIELPAGFSRAKAALSAIKQSYGEPGWATTYNPYSCTRFYLVDEHSQVSFNWPKIEQELDEAFNEYLTDPEEIQAYHQLHQAFEIIKDVYERALKRSNILGQRGAGGIIGEGYADIGGRVPLVFRAEVLKGLFKHGL